MKKERRGESRLPASRPWTTPLTKMTLAAETLNHSGRVEIPPPDHLEEILAPSWAWRMLHKA